MAKFQFILQALTDRRHADHVVEVLGQAGLIRCVVSVAYARRSGVRALADVLSAVANKTTVFVGIRNGSTSAQAVRELLSLNLKLFAVDTSSRTTIFHPKVYLFNYQDKSHVVIGSANMTYNGLHNNIEAGLALDLDHGDPKEKQFVDEVLKHLDDMPVNHPKHVFAITSSNQIDGLLSEGRLVDEEKIAISEKEAPKNAAGARDTLPKMRLSTKPYPVRIPTTGVSAPTAPLVSVPNSATLLNRGSTGTYRLVWESNSLQERDLNIPTGARTNATGSMLWKKGALEGVDQRHYFRDVVFARINWQRDSGSKKHLERATALFRLIIKGVDCGTFELHLSHNTNTKSKTYKQRNSMTQVHWGAAKPLIAQKDLLGRIMSLYRSESSATEFMIEID